MTVVRPETGKSGVRGGAFVDLLLLFALLEEGDADLVAIDPGQLAAAIGEARGRQQQEEFLQMQPFDGTLDGEFRTGLRDVFHLAIAPPGAVDAHHVRSEAALKRDALALAPLGPHDGAPPSRKPAAQPRGFGARLT